MDRLDRLVGGLLCSKAGLLVVGTGQRVPRLGQVGFGLSAPVGPPLSHVARILQMEASFPAAFPYRERGPAPG